SALYAAVGEGHVSAPNVVKRLVTSIGGEDAAEEDMAEVTRPGTRHHASKAGDPGIVVKGMDAGDLWTKLAKCCTPVPGDPIVGFITRGAGVSVHREDCTNVAGLRRQPERMIDVEWTPGAQRGFLGPTAVGALARMAPLSAV